MGAVCCHANAFEANAKMQQRMLQQWGKLILLQRIATASFFNEKI